MPICPIPHNAVRSVQSSINECLDINSIYLFPHEEDILLLHVVENNSSPIVRGEVEPSLYASENCEGPWTWVVSVTAQEFGCVPLPEDYNGWHNAKLVYRKAA